jgi:hypothetical protein
MRWAIAAAVVIGVGLLAIPLAQRFWPFGEFEATVQAAEGQVFEIADTQTAAVAAGAKLQKGEKVRTAKDARAVVKLGDGSTIEMSDRSELYLTKNGEGTTIHLSRGNIVVEAAKQKDGKLFVESGDSLVSVTGTVFSVNNGTKGSRVSVIEGEVNLNHAGKDRMLRPGEQATTNPAIAMIPVKDEVAWSRNAARYAEVLSALASVNADLRNVDSTQCASLDASARPDAGEHGRLRGVAKHRRFHCRVASHHSGAHEPQRSAAPVVGERAVRQTSKHGSGRRDDPPVWLVSGRRDRALSIDG